MAPLEDQQGEGVVEIQDETEVEPVKVARSPSQPTPEQEEAHRVDHATYRSWCKFCVMGRGIGAPHPTDASVSQVPRIGVDYFFITAGGMKRKDELKGEYKDDEKIEEARKSGAIVKCVLVRCFESKNVFAHCIPCKGGDEEGYTAGLIVADVLWLGYSKMILKADNEASVQALLKQVVQRLKNRFENGERVTQEEPAKYDSQSNGATEIGVKLVRGLFRTLKLCLEARVGKYIPVTHALVPWLLEHTCMILNTRHRGDDGCTNWMRIKGRAFNQRILGFAELILYKLPGKGPLHDPDGNMGTRWREGVFLGYHRSANVYIIYSDEGIITARSLMRRPIGNRWSAAKLAEIKATPWSVREKPEVQVRFREDAEAKEEPVTAKAPPNPKRFRINKKDLDEHGYTQDCPQCDHIMRYGSAKPGHNHSDLCRVRMIRQIGQTETGQRRLEQWNERVDRSMAEQIEHSDKAAAAARERGRDDRLAGGDQAPAKPQPRQELGGAEARERGEAAGEATSSRSPSTGMATPSKSMASSSDSQTTRLGSGEGSFLPADEPATAKPRGVDDVRASIGLPADAMDDSDAESRCPRNSDDELVDNEDAMDQDEAPGDAEMGFLGSLQPEACDAASELLLMQLGSVGRSYKRETRQAFGKLVSEIYSPPRITAELQRRPRKHLLPGFALDLTVVDPEDGEAWDFCQPDKREKARRLRRRQKPFLLIGSPECTAFCTWQYLNESKAADVNEIKRQRIRASLHMDFVASLYREQVEDGLYFLHEHPLWATSWKLPSIENLLKISGVERVHGDQCQYGAEVQRGQHRGSPVMKPTGFLSNSPKIRDALSKRCYGRSGVCTRPSGGRHVALEGKLTRDAAVYPRQLCQAVLRGATAQLKQDRRLKPGCFGIQAIDDEEEIHDSLYGPSQGYSGKYRDDLTGQILKDELVVAARIKELEYFTRKGVWVKVPRQRARQATGHPPITVRWVDVNKGDEMNPNYRSRLVARQIKAMDKSGQNYFAPAPPIEALRTVLSMATTRVGDHQPIWDPDSASRTQISFVDVSRAYFNAKIEPGAVPTFVDLPAEDSDHDEMCGELLRHMYGTRSAADGWQEEYSTLLIRLGFRQGSSCPNVFYNQERKIACSVHGDDFTSSGPKPALDWLEHEIGQVYEITIGPRLGPGRGDAKEARALNRIVRWCPDRVEYEADPRQVERLIAECGLEGCKPMATPGVKATFTELENDEELPRRLHTAFRGAAARGNYLAADRIDSQFGCKEVCRWMSRPSMHSWKALKRLCRFLNGLPRLVYVYRQQTVDCIDVYTDTDWAGRPKTRKSTSGGCILMGRHTIKHWSSTQASVSLSSGEAEFNGVVRGAGQGLGYQALLKDLGVSVPLRVWTDSSAAVGICSRQGLGKLRHLDTHTLWIQQAVRNRRIALKKVAGEQNPADLLTKHSISREKLLSLVKLYDCEYREGRAESAPQLRKSVSNKGTMADGGDELGSLEPLAGAEEETVTSQPRMPHLEMNATDLDAQFPSMNAPEDDGLEDLNKDEDDDLLKEGMQIAADIAEEMVRHGRTRREHRGGEDRARAK